VLQHTNYPLSFTTITFPHQIMPLIFIQQIYPSFNIITRQPYHKSSPYFTPNFII
ncbi:23S rRNA (pseudouridine(1915)-N(3))-methyltransferase RlmH, partial [Staphylococcus epidermidis]|uniref:23S rRNA (pseudouridine(1915)-N(3))-methyltransferase RlmH n=1 Tax=Staphylococcus epidermidis TaxID=1282 RepID=UPI0011A10CE3